MQKLLAKGLFCLSATLLSTQAVTAGNMGEMTMDNDPYPVYESQPQSPGLSFAPSQFGYEFFGPMSFQDGKGHAKMQNAFLFAKLIPQKKDSTFSMGLDFFSRMTWLSTTGNEVFDGNRLYTFGLNGNCTYSLSDSTKFFGGASVMLSTDMDAVSWDAFQIGLRAGISQRLSDKLSFQLGVYYTPQIAQAPLLPIIGFRYTINNNWYTQLDPLRFKFINTLSDKISWGPFVGLSAGSWNVSAAGRTLRLSEFSCIMGVQGNFKLGKWGEYSPTLTTELGCTIYNEMQYRNSDGNHELYKTKMDPGFFMQTAIKFEF